MKNLFWIVICTLMLKNSASAEVPAFLRHFEADPASASRLIPEKLGARRPIKFSVEDIDHRNFVIAKDNFRRHKLCTGSQAGEACYERGTFIPLEQYNDDWQLRAFLGGTYDNNLLRLASYNSGSVPVVPWAGHYWPIYQGGIGARYGDPKFPRSESFKVNYKYFNKNYLQTPGAGRDELAMLSPAEKYDYMIGDNQWSLTRSVWTEGKAFLDSTGKVETWMGICHGWAPAAFVVQEPQKAYDVDLQNGKGVMRLYPHDLKGLVSQLWAQANFNYNFLGGRCNSKNPSADSNGRITSSECFDINPSTWHLALTHWVGRDRQSFVLDATYDYEVWNQPISSYELRYFNPVTHQQSSMETSIVPYSEVQKDPYKKYRSPNVRYLVGVISDIKYVVEEEPHQYDSVSDPLSRLVTVTYYYDLELDQEYNIIGGEWYQQAHPDMLWKPAPGAVPAATGEDQLPEWNGEMPVPNDFFKVGVYASAQKIPLSKIINKLVEWSLLQR
jgi:hypothetical protein